MSYRHIQQLARIQDEFEAAHLSLDYSVQNWASLHRLPEFGNASLVQMKYGAENLEMTYIIRLFSAFEVLLRIHFVLRSAGRPDRRSAYDLINMAASKYRIQTNVGADVQRVREYRNQAVHLSEVHQEEMTFDMTRSSLNKFLMWLP